MNFKLFGFGAHAYGFKNCKEESKVWSGAAITPGSKDEMLSLRAEHGGVIGILLVLYAIQIYLGIEDLSCYRVHIWLDNTNVLSRGKQGGKCSNVKTYLVLDYDFCIDLQWHKVDSYIETKIIRGRGGAKGQEPSIFTMKVR